MDSEPILSEGLASPPTSVPDPGQTVILEDGDGDFGDFADFQTFSDSSVPASASNTFSTTSTPTHSATTSSFSSPAHLPTKQPNIFELDMFAFQEFVTNFEEQLLQMFVSPESVLSIKPASHETSSIFTANPGDPNFFFTPTENTIKTSDGPVSPIHSHEYIINDCP